VIGLARVMIAALVLSFAASVAGAQTFPTKPVRIFVPYVPGGALDGMARTLGQALAKSWGNQIVIENRPGAGGIVASQALIQAPADGYTLMMVATGHSLNQFFYTKLPYDTFKDFTAITQVADMPVTFNVGKNSPIKTLKEMMDQARVNPNGLSYGISGYGTSAHLAGELLSRTAGVKMVSIPFKGGAPALTAVIAGEIPLSINPLAEVIGHIQGGTVRALAVSSAARNPSLPDVPTFAEEGFPGYVISNWFGLIAPKGMDAALVSKIQRDVAIAVKDPMMVDYLKKVGAVPVGSAPATFDAFIHAEADKWGPIIKAANIKVE
jgi:tripartite-type tricarboxylate transporter receptor subunit TctC